jgi:hypothetical protein
VSNNGENICCHQIRCYSLRPIILFVNIDVFKHILVVDTFVLEKSNMDWREYLILDKLESLDRK